MKLSNCPSCGEMPAPNIGQQRTFLHPRDQAWFCYYACASAGCKFGTAPMAIRESGPKARAAALQMWNAKAALWAERNGGKKPGT